MAASSVYRVFGQSIIQVLSAFATCFVSLQRFVAMPHSAAAWRGAGLGGGWAVAALGVAKQPPGDFSCVFCALHDGVQRGQHFPFNVE